jgi:transcriptional regulator GlxA family with amidase domain
MDTINTSATTLKPSNEDKVASLCEWIAKNCDHPITWDQLTEQSNMIPRQFI